MSIGDRTLNKEIMELCKEIQYLCKLDHIDIKFLRDIPQPHLYTGTLQNVYCDFNQDLDYKDGMKKPFYIYIQNMDNDDKVKYLADILDFTSEYVNNIGIDLNKYKFKDLHLIFRILYSLACIDLLDMAGIKPYMSHAFCNTTKAMISLISEDIEKPNDRNAYGLYNYEALYARQYAFRMFPIIWNTIKDKYDYYFNNENSINNSWNRFHYDDCKTCICNRCKSINQCNCCENCTGSLSEKDDPFAFYKENCDEFTEIDEADDNINDKDKNFIGNAITKAWDGIKDTTNKTLNS